jgi:hypothetical protein
MAINGKDLNIKQDYNSKREILRLRENLNLFKNQFLGFETWALNLNRILKPNIFLKMERNDFLKASTEFWFRI